MKESFSLSLAQVDVEPNRPDLNVERMVKIIGEETQRKTDLLIFPEMCVPGYMIGDAWEREAFVRDCVAYNDDIAAAVPLGMTAIWGNVAIDPNKTNFDGTIRKYNAAYVAQNGSINANITTYKTHLPTYRQFHDSRHFTSLKDLARELGVPIEELLTMHELVIGGTRWRVGIMLCEDMWWEDYGVNVADILRRKGADFLVNLSCSPWGLGKGAKRHRVVKGLFPPGEGVPFIYVNNVGCQDIGKTTFSFDGRSCIYNANGDPVVEGKPFAEELIRTDFYPKQTCPVPARSVVEVVQPVREIKQALMSGIRQFFSLEGRPRNVVIGLSGGIDSSVNAALFTEALGPDRIFGVNMPTRYNSEQTKYAARALAHNLHIHYAELPIGGDVQRIVDGVKGVVFCNSDSVRTPVVLRPFDEENVQARIRGSQVLAALAPSLNAVISNNSNKTETCRGYFTLYGDSVGALAAIGDLYKGQVVDVGREINREAGYDVIPPMVFDLPPSAELSGEQNVDEGRGDPFWYPYHDQLVRHFVEYLHEPEHVLSWYIDGSLEERFAIPQGSVRTYFRTDAAFVRDLEDWWNAFHLTVFKRYQTPPTIKVSSRAFGYDFHESQVSPYLTRRYWMMKEELLKCKRVAHERVSL